MGHYLLKPGELMLRKGNRRWFEKILRKNIVRRLPGSTLRMREGRYYLDTPLPAEEVNRQLRHTLGLTGFALVKTCAKELDKITEAALGIADGQVRQQSGVKFALKVRRIDKSLPFNSYRCASDIGAKIIEAHPELKVSLDDPDWSITIELRERAYLYADAKEAGGGLPVGTAGRALLMLSGGIDSPVAGYLMARRGLKIEAVYFHTPPYTGEEALGKVKELSGVLSRWNDGITLNIVNFTPVQLTIKERADSDAVTVHSRAAMMKIAERIARKNGCSALITGESLSQVASQTVESIGYTNGAVSLPVLRPLIGMDKEAITTIARKIGSYETSIQPFADCCTLFAPEHPLIRPNRADEERNFISFEISEQIEEASESVEAVEVADQKPE